MIEVVTEYLWYNERTQTCEFIEVTFKGWLAPDSPNPGCLIEFDDPGTGQRRLVSCSPHSLRGIP